MATQEKQIEETVDEAPFADGSADLNNLTEEQWLEWEKNGELPGSKKADEPKEPKEEKTSEESTAPSEEEKAAEADAKPPSESSPDPNRQERKPSESEKRIKELLAQVKELKDEQSRLKTAPKAEPAARPKPSMEDKNADGTLKYPANNAGFEKYTDDLIEWREREREGPGQVKSALARVSGRGPSIPSP